MHPQSRAALKYKVAHLDHAGKLAKFLGCKLFKTAYVLSLLPFSSSRKPKGKEQGDCIGRVNYAGLRICDSSWGGLMRLGWGTLQVSIRNADEFRQR